MRRTLSRMSVGLVWSMTLVSGCGTDFMAPPPNPSSPIAVPETARTIFMVMPVPPEADTEGWSVVAQREANNERVIFRSLGPGPDESSTAEPALVRRAVDDGASALIVVASDAPGLAEAMAEAESKKVPVVVIGRPITAPPGSPPFTNVAPRSFDPTAEQLVRAALADAKKAGHGADGTASILVDRAGGAFTVDRAAALEAAATKAGLKVRLVGFEPPADSPSAAEAMRTILGTLDLTILLAADDQAMQMATSARKTLAPRLKVFVAGYASHRNAMMPGVYGSESAFVEYRSEEMGRLAVQAALDRLRGEEPGRKVEFDSRFRRGLAADSQGFQEYKPILSDKDSPKSVVEPEKTADEPKKAPQ
jgi:ABC-type sugar transport system substrate-binding protein